MREALAVVGVQVHSGVEGEALEVSGLPLDPDGIGTIAPQQAQGIGLRCSEGVGSAGIGLRHLETRAKQPAQAPHDAAEHLLDVGVRGSGQSEKACRFPIADEHAVWNHAMLCGARDYAERGSGRDRIFPPGSRRSRMSFRASDHQDGRRKAACASDRNRFGFFRPRRNLNLGVPPLTSSVGGGCYDRFVNEASSHLSDGHLGALVAAAFMLQWPLPRERDEAVCHGTVRAVESLLVRVGRCRGALDVRIGEGLDALGTGDRVIRLGFSGTGDYARERLGMPASTAQKMARLARELRSRPLLRAAVREGGVSTSAAEAVIKVAQGEAEAFWVARARTGTVRALEAAVKGAGGVEPDEADERWMRLRAGVPAEGRPTVDEAMELAGKATCVTVPKWQRLQGMAEEYLGAHEAPEHGAGVDRMVSDSAGELLESAKEWLEKESARWAFLDQVGPVAAPGPSLDGETDPWRIDAELRRLAEMRARWDEVFGHLAMLFRAMDGWRRLGFASFEHHCKERLGMGARAVEQRAALERRLYELPSLRQAMVEWRLSYEKARLIARYADERSVESWIERAGQIPCIALRRELQGQEDTQMSARGEFDVWVPRRVGGLLALAFGAARKATGRWLSPGECLVKIAEHFIEVWKPMLAERNTVQKQVLARDRGLCQVPFCSRAAAHVHHIEFRSAGGSDDPSNLVSLCAVHHLRGVHMGRLRVSGTAPDQLRWELGAGAGQASQDLPDLPRPVGLDAS